MSDNIPIGYLLTRNTYTAWAFRNTCSHDLIWLSNNFVKSNNLIKDDMIMWFTHDEQCDSPPHTHTHHHRQTHTHSHTHAHAQTHTHIPTDDTHRHACGHEHVHRHRYLDSSYFKNIVIIIWKSFKCVICSTNDPRLSWSPYMYKVFFWNQYYFLSLSSLVMLALAYVIAQIPVLMN